MGRKRGWIILLAMILLLAGGSAAYVGDYYHADAVAAEVNDKKAAAAIETKKTARSAGRKTKAAVKNAIDTVAEKIDETKLVNQMTVGRVKVQRERKAIEKKTAKEEKAAGKHSVKRKAGKLNMVFQSTMGGAITPEQIALKLPKEAVDVYVKIEENKAYWVGKNGEMGSVDIWD